LLRRVACFWTAAYTCGATGAELVHTMNAPGRGMDDGGYRSGEIVVISAR
jgi:hypothetical protein